MSIWDSLQSALRSTVAGAGGLGTLGDISFRVSAWDDIHTFDDLTRSAKSRTASHEIIGQKPLTEYLGPDLQTLSLKIKLHAQRGVHPRDEVEKLIEYCESGQVLTFTVGGKKMGKNKWLIESVGEAVKYYDNKGNILASEVDLTLKEYVVAQYLEEQQEAQQTGKKNRFAESVKKTREIIERADAVIKQYGNIEKAIEKGAGDLLEKHMRGGK
jgi:phage protein U